MKRLVWLTGGIVAAALLVVLVSVLHSKGTGAQFVWTHPWPFARSYAVSTAWHGLDITFKTMDTATGETQVWRYLRDDHDRWRLELLQGKAPVDVSILNGSTQYQYQRRNDHLSVLANSAGAEASNVLVPSRGPRLIASGWTIVGTSNLKGFEVVEIAAPDGSERYWITTEHGLPVKYVAGNGKFTWELLTASFRQKHADDQFRPPQATHVSRS